MAKILLHYRVHSHEVPAAKIVPEVKRLLEGYGHNVIMQPRRESELSNVLKLKRLLACVSLANPSHLNHASFSRLVSRNLLKKLQVFSIPENPEGLLPENPKKPFLLWKQVLRLNSKLKRALSVSRYTLNKRGKALELRQKKITSLNSLVDRETFSSPLPESASKLLLSLDRFHYEKLSHSNPSTHLFDFHNTPLWDLYSNSRQKKEVAKLTGRMHQMRMARQSASLLRRFKPEVFFEDLADEDYNPADEGMYGIFFSKFNHHSVDKNVHHYFIEMPMITSPIKGKWQNVPGRSDYEDHYAFDVGDFNATKEAGLLKGVPEAIAKHIHLLVAGKIKPEA